MSVNILFMTFVCKIYRLVSFSFLLPILPIFSVTSRNLGFYYILHILSRLENLMTACSFFKEERYCILIEMCVTVESI